MICFASFCLTKEIYVLKAFHHNFHLLPTTSKISHCTPIFHPIYQASFDQVKVGPSPFSELCNLWHNLHMFLDILELRVGRRRKRWSQKSTKTTSFVTRIRQRLLMLSFFFALRSRMSRNMCKLCLNIPTCLPQALK